MPTKPGYTNPRVAEAMGQQGDVGGDSSFGNPMDDMALATHTALAEAKNAGPLIADRVTDAERMLNDVMALEQVADRIATQVERGDIGHDQARRQADRELRKAAGTVRDRWNRLTTQTQGLPAVLELRAFPDPGRDAQSAEVKADIERTLGPKASSPLTLVPAMTDLARDAVARGDMAVAAQLAGDFGRTLIDNAYGDEGSDDDRKQTVAEVRRSIIDAAASSGKLTDTQRTAVEQLQRMDDLNDAVTSAVFLATMRWDDAFARLPWSDDGRDRTEAERDPERSPFYRDPMRSA
jgi:hypothetical protein